MFDIAKQKDENMILQGSYFLRDIRVQIPVSALSLIEGKNEKKKNH